MEHEVIQRVLKLARDILGAHGENWMKDIWQDGTDYCITAAVCEAADRNQVDVDPVLEYVGGRVMTVSPEWDDCVENPDEIAYWADMPERTWAEICYVLEA